jgi:hypothetical protein
VAGGGANRRWWDTASFQRRAYGVPDMKRLLPAGWDHKVKRSFDAEEMNKLEEMKRAIKRLPGEPARASQQDSPITSQARGAPQPSA